MGLPVNLGSPVFTRSSRCRRVHSGSPGFTRAALNVTRARLGVVGFIRAGVGSLVWS